MWYFFKNLINIIKHGKKSISLTQPLIKAFADLLLNFVAFDFKEIYFIKIVNRIKEILKRFKKNNFKIKNS